METRDAWASGKSKTVISDEQMTVLFHEGGKGHPGYWGWLERFLPAPSLHVSTAIRKNAHGFCLHGQVD